MMLPCVHMHVAVVREQSVAVQSLHDVAKSDIDRIPS